MKKKLLTILLAATMMTGLFTGCQSKQETPAEDTKITTEAVKESQTQEDIDKEDVTENTTEEIVAEESKDGMLRSPLTGEWVAPEIAKARPVACMVENTKVTLPQYGIGKADVIYECPVEGGITRMMAIFQDYSGLDKIGNVRSCRPYYVSFAREFDAVYVHAGASSQGKDLLSKGLVDEIDGITGVGGAYFFRDDSRVAPHNLYTSSENVTKAIANLGFRSTIDESYSGHYQFAADDEEITLEDGMDANVVSVYFPNNMPWFEYNDAEGVYYRYEFGAPQVDAISGEQVKVKNVILQYMEASFYNEEKGTWKLDWRVGGKGLYITNGKAIDITWKRADSTDITHYYDANGNEIKINQGKTWVSVVQNSYADRNKCYASKEEFQK